MIYLRSFYYWLVGLVYFGCFLSFGILVSFIFKPAVYDPWLKAMLRFLFKIMHCRIEVAGAGHIDPSKTYVFMANHVSLFDIPLLGGYIPGFVRGIEAQRQHRWPLYGWMMRRVGNISIDRDNIYSSIRSMHVAMDQLLEGTSIIILPEGHRTSDGHLGVFKKLPFHLVKQVKKEIVPIGMSGLYTALRKGSGLLRPGLLRVHFGPPITQQDIARLSVIELRDLTRKRIGELIQEP